MYENYSLSELGRISKGLAPLTGANAAIWRSHKTGKAVVAVPKKPVQVKRGFGKGLNSRGRMLLAERIKDAKKHGGRGAAVFANPTSAQEMRIAGKVGGQASRKPGQFQAGQREFGRHQKIRYQSATGLRS